MPTAITAPYALNAKRNLIQAVSNFCITLQGLKACVGAFYLLLSARLVSEVEPLPSQPT